MSKRNLFLGTASGKVGDVVFYRSKGEQKARGYVIPKNAKSYKQMVNRLGMLNPVSAFRAMKPMIEGNFLTKKTNQSDYNAFISANKSASMFFISKGDLMDNACVPFGMQLSRGTDGIRLQPRYAWYQNPMEKNDPLKACIAIVEGFNFSGKTIMQQDLGGEDYLKLSDADLFDFVKKYFQASIPAGFTIRIMACDYGLDSDHSNDVWQPYIVSKSFDATGICITTTSGPKPSISFPTEGGHGYEMHDLDLTSIGLLFSSEWTGPHDGSNLDAHKTAPCIGLSIGRHAITAEELGALAVAISIEWSDAAGKHVTSSFVNKPCWDVKGDSEFTDEVYNDALDVFYLTDFLYNGFYFQQLLEENPYKGEIQPVAVGRVPMDSMLELYPFAVDEDEVEAP